MYRSPRTPPWRGRRLGERVGVVARPTSDLKPSHRHDTNVCSTRARDRKRVVPWSAIVTTPVPVVAHDLERVIPQPAQHSVCTCGVKPSEGDEGVISFPAVEEQVIRGRQRPKHGERISPFLTVEDAVLRRRRGVDCVVSCPTVDG